MKDERPPVTVLFVHNGIDDDHHLRYLIDAGLDVSDVHAHQALSTAVSFQPQIIVLDFTADGDTLAALKSHPATKDIPVIALVELLKKN